jgi:hypothetical protein
VFRVRYRRNVGVPQVQIQLGTSNANTTWTAITGGTASNAIEVVYRAVGSGSSLQLFVNGSLAQTLTPATAGTVGAVRLGVVTSSGNSTQEYFDGFASKRSATPLFGP